MADILTQPPVLAPGKTEADFAKNDDPAAGARLSLQQVRFVRALLSDGTFDYEKAVAYAWPNIAPERRSAKAVKQMRRTEIREALHKIVSESMELSKDMLKQRVIRRIVLAMNFDPFRIIDQSGRIRKDVDINDLGELRQLIQGIDPKTGKVEFVSRDRATESLTKYLQLIDDSPKVTNNIVIYLPAKKSVEEWNQQEQGS